MVDFSNVVDSLGEVINHVPGLSSLGYQPTHDPIIQTLPSRTRSFSNKYSSDGELAQLLPNLPDDLRSSLIRFDYQRSLSGQAPLSTEQTLKVVQTFLDKKPATEPPKHTGLLDTFGNALRDVQAIGLSIPKIPQALVNEARAIGSGDQFNQEGGIAGLLRSPGIRMLPGAYTAGNIAAGDFDQIQQHPIFTLLDVLPAAQQLHLTPGTNPAIAAKLAPLKTALGDTRLGEFVTNNFGADVKQTSRIINRHQMQLMREAGGDLPPNHPISQLIRDTIDMHKTGYKEFNITPEEAINVHDILTSHPELRPTLTPNQQVFATKLESISKGYQDYLLSENLLGQIDIYGTPEIYDLPTFRKIMAARSTRARYGEMIELRDYVNPANTDKLLTPDLFAKKLLDLESSTTLSAGEKLNRMRAYELALNTAGYDTTPLRKLFSKIPSPKKAIEDGILTKVASASESLVTPAPLRPMSELIETIKSRTGKDPLMRGVYENLLSGDLTRARQLATQISRRTRFDVTDVTGMLDELSRHSRAQKFLGRTNQYSESGLGKLVAKEQSVIASSPSARMIPVIESKLQSALHEQISATTTPNFDTISQYINDKLFNKAGELANDSGTSLHPQALANELSSSWVQLRDALPADQQPIFIHQMSPSAITTLRQPTLIPDKISTLSQIKERINNATPSVNEPALALTHQGLEILRRHHLQRAADDITTAFARPKLTDNAVFPDRIPVAGEYEAEARLLAASDPTLDYRGHLERLIKQDWSTYDPAELFGISGPKVSGLSEGNELLIPKHVADNLRRMHPQAGGRLSALFDPYMHLFRTSLLTLRPTFHLNNIFGGLTLMMARTDPTVLGYFQKARQMLADGTLPEELGLGTGAGSVPRELIAHQYMAGGTLRRWFEESTVGKGLDKLNKFNGTVDDLYRSMSYLYGHDKAYSKFIDRGMEATTAESASREAGLTLAKKIMPDWETYSPFERTIMKSIFPFYGWMRHITKYVLSYPADHPLRASILDTFARTEMEDNQYLPDRFMGMTFLGDMDENGNTLALNVGAANPFTDVSNLFTLAGFVRSTNPLIATALRGVGVDTAAGGPELYPDLAYDPFTGRLKPKTPGLLGTFIQSTIPQTRAITDLFTRNNDYKNLLRTNPEAAAQRLRAELGIPSYLQHVNIPEQVFRAELARQDAQSNAFSAALKYGEDGAAQEFPGLRAMLDQVRELQSQPNSPLAQYVPPNGTPPPLGGILSDTFLNLER